ncbi:TB2/DP1, HVA22 family-domain-containing protein, partial [Globomyces pollinis-pini]
LDTHLEQFHLLKEFEKKTNVPKVFVASGAAFIFFVLIFFNVWGDLLTNILGFVYPSYASFKAIESSNKDDDVQWLTYWTVFAFLNLIEFFSDILLFWLPFYYFFKATIILYLVLPQTRGALTVYQSILRPFLVKEQANIDAALNAGINKLKVFFL